MSQKEITDRYKTILQSSRSEFKEKKSKFIGITAFCKTEEEVKLQLQIWRNEFSGAGHICYAYRLGADKSKYRANDDGEPANSAGAPILGQIQSFDLTNILIGVVRYYGGIKLGVGGLISAYREAAKIAIEAGQIEEIEIFRNIEISFSYEDMPFVMNFIKQNALISFDQDFALSCKIKVALPILRAEEFLTILESHPQLQTTILD